jgi:hypothetical protein
VLRPSRLLKPIKEPPPDVATYSARLGLIPRRRCRLRLHWPNRAPPPPRWEPFCRLVDTVLAVRGGTFAVRTGVALLSSGSMLVRGGAVGVVTHNEAARVDFSFYYVLLACPQARKMGAVFSERMGLACLGR